MLSNVSFYVLFMFYFFCCGYINIPVKELMTALSACINIQDKEEMLF